MFSTRKRIFIIICVVALFVFTLRILLLNSLPGWTIQSSIQTRSDGTPVLVVVFYESLCPDSKYFLTKQLLPAFKIASSIMEVQLVPYGKATTSNTEGKLYFDCQHGPTECQANIYHACAVEIIKDPMLRLEVISCMIRDNRLPQSALHKCAKQHKVENIDIIQKCFDSDKGFQLLKLNGEATNALRPPVTFIPTITVDGFQGRQASILKNLLSEVCQVFGDKENAKNICTQGQS